MSDIVLAKIGRGMASRVPYDAEIEYLESVEALKAGSQITFPVGNKATFECKLHIFDTRDLKFMGLMYNEGGAYQGCFQISTMSGGYRTQQPFMGTLSVDTPPVDTARPIVYKSPDPNHLYWTIDGVRYPVSSCRWNNAGNFHLFHAGVLNYANDKGRNRLYWCKVYEDGVLTHDLIPVRVGDVGCMYDRACPHGGPLGNGLYMNMGSGAFALGRDIRVNNLWKMPSKVVFMAGGPATVRTQNYFDDGVMWGAVASNGYTGSSGSASIGVLSITSAPSMYYPCAGVLKLKKSAKFRLTYDFTTRPSNCAALLYKAVDGGYLFESSQAKVVPAGTTSIVFDFETKADTEYVVIPFYSSGSNVEQTVSNIVVYERK